MVIVIASFACASGVRREKVCLFPWVRDPYLEEVVHQEAAEVDWEGTHRRKPLASTDCFSSSASLRARTRVKMWLEMPVEEHARFNERGVETGGGVCR